MLRAVAESQGVVLVYIHIHYDQPDPVGRQEIATVFILPLQVLYPRIEVKEPRLEVKG